MHIIGTTLVLNPLYANEDYKSVLVEGDVEIRGGFFPRYLEQANEPANGTGSTQCRANELVIWKDTDDSKVYLCFNDATTVKTVELT